MKKYLSLLLLCALLLSLCACSDPAIGGENTEQPVSADPAEAPEAVIELKGDSISAPGRGVSVKGCVVTIGTPGSYTVRGTLNDGRIVIDLKENPGKVTLFLDGADITCLTDSAICLIDAKELNLVLADGSVNRVVSGTEAALGSYDENSQGAAIFAEDDLDIQGGGSLTVLGYLNNGITCKDDLKIKGGSLEVIAVHNGIRASESVTVSGGTIRVDAGNDGVKASSAKKAGKGFVQIEGGTLSVRSMGDGVSAETELRISGGSLSVETVGDPAAQSCKGLKGRTGVLISGGELDVRAEDHAIRSGATLTVSGGTVAAQSRQGKGLSAETELRVEAGALQVKAADDGLASADTVRILGGETEIVSGADGIQGGKKSTGFTAEVGTVSIEGGQILIAAFNKPLDAKARLLFSGGSLLACGSGTPKPESEIPWLFFTAQGRSGDSLTLSANELLTLEAAYSYSSVCCFDPVLSEGQRYELKAGSETLEATASR